MLLSAANDGVKPAQVLVVLAALMVSDVSQAGLPKTFVAERQGSITLLSDLDSTTRRSLVQRFGDFMVSWRATLRRVVGKPGQPRPVQVALFESAADYARHARHDAPERTEHGGYYDGRRRRVVTHYRDNPLGVILHELSHAALGDAMADAAHTRLTRAGWPVWLEEGLAEYASTYVHAKGASGFGAPHAARLATVVDAIGRRPARGPSLEMLLNAPIGRFGGATMATYYAHAWALTHLLMTTPTLALKLPRYLERVRTGANSRDAFVSEYGDLAALQRTFEGHIIALANRPQAARRWFAPGPRRVHEQLHDWTRHARGEWRADASGGIEGRTRGSYDYLTRAVGPLHDFTLDIELQRRGDGTPGIVLGYHGTEGYPYHTLIGFGRRGVTVRSASSENQLGVLGATPGDILDGKRWVPIRLRIRDGVLIAWQGRRHLVTVTLPRRAVSLVGVYLHGGSAAFRRVEVTPASARSAQAQRPTRPARAVMR